MAAKNNALNKPVTLSPELEAVCGKGPLSQVHVRGVGPLTGAQLMCLSPGPRRRFTGLGRQSFSFGVRRLHRLPRRAGRFERSSSSAASGTGGGSASLPAATAATISRPMRPRR